VSSDAPRQPTPQAVKLGDIPIGHYHEVMEHGHPIRQAWHQQKFARIAGCLPPGPGLSILDVGCFAGSFLSLLPPERFSRQVGIDILPEQIEYAKQHFETPYRTFRHVPDIKAIADVPGMFDCATLIEVIEHLHPQELDEVFRQVVAKLNPGGIIAMSTPNYASTWPILEVLLNKLSDVSYDEQHVIRFNFWNGPRKLRKIAPVLAEQCTLKLRTTTHFLSPFLAMAGVRLANSVSQAIPHSRWKFPFGNLLIMAFQKNR
jgi:2-polyprenyl-3-methyl-5-hydroxy-6-metoxy-1,4-benzoquinol methylase